MWASWFLRLIPGQEAIFDSRAYVGDYETLLHATYCLRGQRRTSLKFSHYESMGTIDIRGVASMDSRGLIARIILGGPLDFATYEGHPINRGNFHIV